MNKELTDKKFWNLYWENVQLPSTVDQNFSFDRCLSHTLLKRLQEVGSKGTVLEIGASPGKWLAWLAETGEYSVSAVEYSENGIDALQKNFQLLGIQADRLYLGDFFKLEPDQSFDLVMSLGFIEHFDDPVSVIEQHLNWLKPDGILVLGVPNFNGIHGFFQKRLDISVWQAHNTKIMSLEFFKKIQDQLNIKAHSVEYLGSFEPALPMSKSKVNITTFLPKVILKIASYVRRIKLFDRLNSQHLSSYILAVYTKTR